MPSLPLFLAVILAWAGLPDSRDMGCLDLFGGFVKHLDRLLASIHPMITAVQPAAGTK
jgi:hypothetical protein